MQLTTKDIKAFKQTTLLRGSPMGVIHHKHLMCYLLLCTRSQKALLCFPSGPLQTYSYTFMSVSIKVFIGLGGNGTLEPTMRPDRKLGGHLEEHYPQCLACKGLWEVMMDMSHDALRQGSDEHVLASCTS